jgi:UDP-N-acetyl-2-amino-2-deoxyglucuronate dehydrogenase
VTAFNRKNLILLFSFEGLLKTDAIKRVFTTGRTFNLQLSTLNFLYLELMGTSLRFAIIGCGKIAPRHAEQAARHGQLVAVCDIVKEKADNLAKAYNARAYTSLDDLLNNENNIDIIAICTPNGLHAEHSVIALNKGIHVLCEKPLCIRSKEARKMIETSGKSGKKLFVVKSTRYNPALIELKKLLDQKALGQVYSFQLNCFWNRPAAYYAGSWKGTTDMDGGTLFTQFSHYIDALLWLFGDIKQVSGWRKNTAHQGVIHFEDNGIAALEMANGMIGGLNWSVNTFGKNMEVSLTVIAEKGTVRIGGQYMNEIEYQFTSGTELAVSDAGQANDYGFYKGSMSNHDKVYENLLIALQDTAHPFANAHDGQKTVEAIERIYKSVSLL